MKLLVPALLLAVAWSGCLSEEGGITDFAASPDCPVRATIMETVSFGNGFGAARVGSPDERSFVIETAEATGWNAREASCVQRLEVLISWTNAPDEGADLYVGAVIPGTTVLVRGHDEQQFALDGEHTESVVVPTAYEGYSGAAFLEGVEIVIGTEWAALTANGIDVMVTVLAVTDD